MPVASVSSKCGEAKESEMVVDGGARDAFSSRAYFMAHPGGILGGVVQLTTTWSRPQHGG